MSTTGYYRFPTIHRDTVVFASEDDLWTVSAAGGIARRLTTSPGVLSRPFFSPDGRTLAFSGREEGHAEVYTMPAEGGVVRRVTYLGVTSNVIGWTPDGRNILFSSDHGQAIDRSGAVVWQVSPAGGLPENLKLGQAVSISMRGDGRVVLGRNNNDPATWKRYRGGTAGQLWVDAEGSGAFRHLIRLKGNLARPMWIGDRIFFVSDHEGYGNLYSCRPDGSDLRRHTHHEEFYVRSPGTDGERIVYHAGADLWLLDPETGKNQKIEIAYYSQRTQRQRKFADPARHLETFAPHPDGHSLALTARGRSYTMGNWEGAVIPQGGDPVTPREPVRYRMTRWLNDGKRVVAITDRGGVETLEIHSAVAQDQEPQRLEGLDIGRPYAIRVSPTSDQLVLSNHRNELVFVDLELKQSQVIDRNRFGHMQGFDWSPDGRWIAYGCPLTQYTTGLRLWDRTSGNLHTITRPVLADFQPVFDPDGKYLYFLGSREMNPVYDQLHFDLGFPRGVRPYLITLQASIRSPFQPVPHKLQKGTPAKPEEATEGANGERAAPSDSPVEPKPAETTPTPVEIDIEGIEHRVVAFPLPLGVYGQIDAVSKKLLYTTYPVEGAIQEPRPQDSGRATLEMYDLESLKQETLVGGITDFQLSKDRQTLYYRAANRLRAVPAGAKPDEKTVAEPPGRRSGWIDFGRIKLSVDPAVEWRQMAHEAWRLQREFFWTEDMSQVDWEKVWKRYSPLIERVGSRGEFSDLMWEMQGELGTSHAYEGGGDYRPEPSYPQGFLGADYAWDDSSGAYRITHIVEGASGEVRASSPLRSPGANVKEGDRLVAINGRKLTRDVLPQELLLHHADTEVILTIQRENEDARDVTVRTLRSEFPARYREWVESNREKVHAETDGRVGYVHLPDMGATGFGEFHRLYLAEAAYDGLIVDVRFNRGGHVSQLILEKLARKRIGYDISRWGEPAPYPEHSIPGPMVALCNQFAGSDGDIFSHAFKLMKLGPLIGTRTWGGVIGIWPRNPLADGSMTTQPEFSYWFQDVGWGVENYGTDPDIEIDIAPQDYARGQDPQLDKAIAVIKERLEAEPIARPTFGDRPRLVPLPLPLTGETSS